MNINRLSCSLLFFVLITTCGLAQNNPVKKVIPPPDYQSKIDVIYTQVGDWKGRMDLYVDLSAEKKLPVLMNIHGGGWNHGSKESQTGFNIFFKEKFAVANVEYRLVQTSYAPGAIEDIRVAIEYLKLNHEALNIDPENIVLMGASAGAHLALMAGLLGNDRRFDANCQTQSTDMRVKAIIDKYGPVDFSDPEDEFYNYKSLIWWMGDKAADLDFRKEISPITYVTEKSAPVLIIHGTSDPIVPYTQSLKLKEELDKKGVYNEFISVEKGLHGKFDKSKNNEINKSIVDFLKKVIGN